MFYTKSVAWGIFGIFLTLVGIFAICSAIRSRAEVAESAKWLTAPGRILKADLQTTIYVRRTVYLPRVEYEYTVQGGRTFRSSRVNFGARWSDLATAQAVMQRFQANASIPVYYDPSQPSAAVLDREQRSSGIATWWGVAVIGVGLILVTNWLLLRLVADG